MAKNYHERLRARVNQMVADAKLSLSDHDLLKEVALFADRADISEEITRLGGHLDQFISTCKKTDGTGPAGDGRKLDFIAQEMLREANTIASKANDTTIARLTVDIKSAIDRIKEQVQNAGRILRGRIKWVSITAGPLPGCMLGHAVGDGLELSLKASHRN